MLEKSLPALAFKSSVIGLRMVNNVLGGMTFVMLARVTESQSASAEDNSTIADEESSDEEKKLLNDEIPSK